MPTRVSTAQIFDGTHAHILKARDQQVTTAEQSATQKKLVRPSDNVGGWVKVNSLKDDQSVRETLNRNAAVASHVLSTTEGIFENVFNSLTRAYELAIAQAGNSDSLQNRQMVASEARELYNGVIQTLNTRFANRTLLGGFKSQGIAFDEEGNFLGDSGQIEIEVDRGLKIPINISAEQAVLGRGVLGGTNVIEALKTLLTGLEENNTEFVNSSIDLLRKSLEQMTTARAEIGGRMNGIKDALARHSLKDEHEAGLISEIEDADAIKVFSDLARDQTILNAVISTGQKLLNDQPFEKILG